MTVKDLIEKLKEFPEDYEVIHAGSEWPMPIDYIQIVNCHWTDGDTVVLSVTQPLSYEGNPI